MNKELIAECVRVGKLAKEGKVFVLDASGERQFRNCCDMEGWEPFDHVCVHNGEVWIEALPPIEPLRNGPPATMHKFVIKD